MQRRTLMAAAAAGALGGLSACAGAPAPAAALGPFSAEDIGHALRLRERALADGTAWALLQQLCTEVGARPAGSAADAKAQAWAVGALGGLRLQGARAESLPLRIWQRGPARARLLAPESRELVMAALGNSVAAPSGGVDAELAYYPDLAALRADTLAPGQSRAHGRIVFIDQPTERTRDGRGYGAAVPARLNGAVEAARRGALALAIRSIGTTREPIAHTGAMAYDLSAPRIPAFAISMPDAERVAALHQAGQRLRLQFELEARSGVEATTANVIAEWRGTDLANEIVLLGAHLDSWDVGQGAVDDGAGVAIVSAAAGLIAAAGRRPRRTIRVVLFGNEENGFDGARAYGDRYKDQLHQFVSESDFGAGRIWRFASRVQEAAMPAMEAIASLLAPLGIAMPAEGRNQGNPGPDAGVLMRRHRWPAIGLTQDGSRYFDVHHTVHDTLERVDAAALPQNVAAWAVVAWLAAQAPMGFGPPTL